MDAEAVGQGYLGGRQYAVVVALTAAIVGGIVASHAPPAVRGLDTPQTEFSGARAFADVVALTAFGPRPAPPMGEQPVPAHEQGQKWVARRLTELGLVPTIEEGTACTPRGSCETVRNVVALLDPGGAASREQAVLLLAHYDSVPAGPGAGDDAAGVASVLEIVRAIQQAGPLQRPLLVVIDDGEERGLFGARVLCNGPWVSRIGTVLNFEARGNAGQTAMFETSERSAWLVELYGRSVARPVASSLIYSLYRALPNDTDLTITKQAGLRGLNFAFADRDWDYHTARDSAANLDQRSLQHMGDQGLAVARSLLQRASLPAVDDDAVWFDLFTLRLVVYRALWAKVLAVLQLVLLGLVVGQLLRRDRRSGRAMVGGAARVVLTLGLAVVAGFVVSKVISALTGQPRPWRSRPLPSWLAFTLAAGAVGSAGQLFIDWLVDLRVQRAGRGVDAADGGGQAAPPVNAQRGPARLWALYASAAGGLVLWTVPSLLLAFRVPGASYPFTLPALLGSGALLVAVWRGEAGEGTEPKSAAAGWRAFAVLLALALPALLLWLPIMRVLLVMVGANLHPTATVPMALLVTLTEPLHRLFSARRRGLMPAVLLLLTLACGIWAVR